MARARRAATKSGSARVLVIAPYPLGTAPSQRFRFEQYVEPLSREGIELDVRPLLDARTAGVLHRRGFLARKSIALLRGAARRLRDLLAARRHDLVFVHRESFPLGFPLFERALAATGVPYLFDLDDAIYLPNASPANRFLRAFKIGPRLWSSVRDAALVVAGSEHLARWARALTPRVRVIPTTIDLARYAPRPAGDDGAAPLCLGWTGSATTFAHLEPLAPVLATLQRSHGVRVRLVGGAAFRLPDVEVEALPWRADTEREDLLPIDVGLMPLPDDEWARGKCGLKALQYMALGIPAVLSPVGANLDIAEGGAARLAGCDAEWLAALAELLASAEERRRLGAAGRARVVERYSVEANLPLYVAAIREAMAGR
jgi:glycosyltransferase involved in cell wall biosynthesis